MELHEWSSENPEFIVGIGTSAGGLESLQQFFDYMPEESGTAKIVRRTIISNY
jgi:two-component system CheB/CheR fusion protein